MNIIYFLYEIITSVYKRCGTDNEEKDNVVGFGILGKVYLANEFSKKITEKIEESSNPIIGNTIKIENIEVAEKDFPKTMNWEDAKKACENLGSGWRLPSKKELNTLYLNKDKIGGFANDAYWSSTEFDYGTAWFQVFNDGLQVNVDKYGAVYVRAIRAF